jgi:NAD(P)-dependent dehydrogenase (short-subunit alcohol dehydrogenase family)
MALPANARAVVTGAGSGLGRALCQELARRGARVLASDIDVEGAVGTVAALGSGAAHAVRCDVTKLSEVEQLAIEAERVLGGVDLIVNNAGVAVGGPVGEVPIESWRWIVDVNLWGVIHGCHVFVPRLRRQGSGHVLNVASAAGLLSSPNLGPYNATKAAVVALSETLYGELAAEGVGVSVLCPTFFQTNIADAARVYADPEMMDTVRELMTSAKLQADGVARAALDGVARGDLYIVPHADGRWMWRFKRLSPSAFQRLTPKLLAWRAARRRDGKS